MDGEARAAQNHIARRQHLFFLPGMNPASVVAGLPQMARASDLASVGSVSTLQGSSPPVSTA